VDPTMLPAAGDGVLARIEEFAGRWGRAAHGQILFAPVVDGEVVPDAVRAPRRSATRSGRLGVPI
jgi:hypothetical protein